MLPGLHALWLHRLPMHIASVWFAAAFNLPIQPLLTGIEIHPEPNW